MKFLIAILVSGAFSVVTPLSIDSSSNAKLKIDLKRYGGEKLGSVTLNESTLKYFTKTMKPLKSQANMTPLEILTEMMDLSLNENIEDSKFYDPLAVDHAVNAIKTVVKWAKIHENAKAPLEGKDGMVKYNWSQVEKDLIPEKSNEIVPLIRTAIHCGMQDLLNLVTEILEKDEEKLHSVAITLIQGNHESKVPANVSKESAENEGFFSRLLKFFTFWKKN